MKRLLVTGSRNYADKTAVYRGIKEAVWLLGGPADEITLVHGGARGADSLAGMIGAHMLMPIEVHPADWETHRNAAGPIRNREMVAAGADLCIGFPLENSRGTWDCLHAAAKAGIPTMWWNGHLTAAALDEPGASKAGAPSLRRMA